MKRKLLSILALLLVAVTGAWAQTETLLTTINSIGNYGFCSGSKTFDGKATVTFSGSVDNSNDDAGWYFIGSEITMTVTAVEGYTITRVKFYCKDGSASDEEAPFEAVLSSVSYNPITKVNGTSIGGYGVNKIEVYGYATPAPVNVTANEGEMGEYWATYYNATQGFTADANTTVYKAAVSVSSVVLTEVADIPADNAVILKSTAASITLTPAATTTSDFTGNELKGGTTVASGCDAYTLSRGDGTGAVGFYKYSGALTADKAHLDIPSSAPARGFYGFGEGDATAIEAPTATVIIDGGETYDLTGRRIEGQPTQKGIYVRNGQKYIVK